MLKQNRILLEERIPIKTIEEPFCKKCMDNVDTGKDYCKTCEYPHPIVNDWYFNKVKCLGKHNNHEYNNFKIPINILSILISLLKFNRNVKTNEYAGKLLADGLFQIFIKYSHVFENSSYLAFSPKFDKSEKNQCDYIVGPLLRRLKDIGINLVNIGRKIERVKDVGKNTGKDFDQRFIDIKGVHKVNGIDLKGAKVIIIDDVYTTGSTSWDLSRALKEQNAGEINVLAAGRHILYNKWIENEYSNFDDLILYFSDLDIDRDKTKIDEVKIKEFNKSKDNQINACFKGSSSEYQLLIDFKSKRIKHNCYDFVQNKKHYYKRFCKHITKVFIRIRAQEGDKSAESLLNQIYNTLDEWMFEDY